MRLDSAVSKHVEDPRLDLLDLYVFQSPVDPSRSALILTANPDAGGLYPGAVYRLTIDHNGDLRSDISFSFVYSEPVDGRQSADVYLAIGSQAPVIAAVGSKIFGGVEVSLDETPRAVGSGGFSFFAGVRSDPAFVDLDGTGRDSRAGANVMAMMIELPNSYLSASPSVNIWARCSLLEDDEWVHTDRVGKPWLSNLITTDDTRDEYNAGEPNRDRERWMRQLIDVMARTGGYSRDEAISAIDAEGTLPDVLTFNPAKPAAYPNGRTLTDDVVGRRLAFLNKVDNPAPGLSPHTDLLPGFPYLGPPH